MLAPEGRRGLGPHHPDNLQRLGKLRNPLSARRVAVAIGAVLLFVPASAQAENESPTGEHLQGCPHLGQQGWVAIPLAEHEVPDPEARKARCEPGEPGPTFQHRIMAELEVVAHPKRCELRWKPGDLVVIEAKQVGTAVRRKCLELKAKFEGHALLPISPVDTTI